MNILVTGGTGLIGSALCKMLENDHQITVLSRNSQRAHSVLGKQVKVINRLTGLSDLNEYDAVINLAGETIAGKRWNDKQKHVICQSRWTLTQQLVDLIAASSTPPDVFISGSAIGIYGRQDAQPIDEDFTQCHCEFSNIVCQQWERIAQQAAPHSRVCLLRTGLVLSKQGGALKKMLPAFKLGMGAPLASGDQYMSWIHIDDMVNAIIWLLTTPSVSGPVNFTAPNPVTNQEFTRQLSATLRRPVFFPIPSAALRLLLGEMSDLVIYGQNVVPKKLTQSGYQFKFNNLKDALNNLLV